MDADNRGTGEVEEVEVEERKTRKASTASFDEGLMPTCMIVSMVVGLGFILLVFLYWGFTNFDSITR